MNGFCTKAGFCTIAFALVSLLFSAEFCKAQVCSDSLTNDQCNLLKKNDNQFCSGNGKEICAKTCEDCSGKNDIMKS